MVDRDWKVKSVVKIRKLAVALIIVVTIAGLLLFAGLRYVSPVQELDLRYEQVSMADQLMDMWKARRFEIEITEDELNHLLKKQLQQNTMLSEQWQVTGAQFHLQGNEGIADVNLMYASRYPVGMKLYFELKWQEPELTAAHKRTELKQWSVPAAWFSLEPLSVNMNEYLPALVKVKHVDFSGDSIKLTFGLR